MSNLNTRSKGKIMEGINWYPLIEGSPQEKESATTEATEILAKKLVDMAIIRDFAFLSSDENEMKERYAKTMVSKYIDFMKRHGTFSRLSQKETAEQVTLWWNHIHFGFMEQFEGMSKKHQFRMLWRHLDETTGYFRCERPSSIQVETTEDTTENLEKGKSATASAATATQIGVNTDASTTEEVDTSPEEDEKAVDKILGVDIWIVSMKTCM